MAIFDELKARVLARREMKRAPVAIHAIDEAGVFEGYASVFNIVDLGRDMVLPGAFRETLQRRGAPRVKMLWQHEAGEPIGSWLSIAEDARGLKVKGRLNLAVSRAREVLALMREGVVDGLSIGFRTEKSFSDRATGIRRLQKIDLWEISIVTFPMLPQARVSSVKRRNAPSPLFAGAARALHAANALGLAEWKLAACALEVKFLKLARALDAKAPGRRADGDADRDVDELPGREDAEVHLAAGGPRPLPRRNIQSLPATPAQLQRFEQAEKWAAEAVARLRQIERGWQPKPSTYSTIEGAIRAAQSDRDQADARLNELRLRAWEATRELLPREGRNESMDRLLRLGADKDNGNMRFGEISTAVRLERELGSPVSRSDRPGTDFVDRFGRTWDAMGGSARDEYFNFAEFTGRLQNKLNNAAADRIVLDISNLGATNTNSLLQFVAGLPSSYQARIRVVR
jgi:HK97 family phage prohead protease